MGQLLPNVLVQLLLFCKDKTGEKEKYAFVLCHFISLIKLGGVMLGSSRMVKRG